MDSRPDQAKQALAHVREASRSALDELRATVGLLRQSGEPEAPMEPAPGLAVLDHLLDGFRRAGLHVTVESRDADGPASAPLPASVDLTAYRVIQESLTNVQKHVGPCAEAVVRISRDQVALEVVVDDDGVSRPPSAADCQSPVVPRPAAAPDDAVPAGASARPPTPLRDGTGGGHGLLGMHERAGALGGVCRTGTRPGGGFRVWVRLPLSAPPRTARPLLAPPVDGAVG
jgi:signal transduction histidine kinase